jgi:uncharacterized membrane protein
MNARLSFTIAALVISLVEGALAFTTSSGPLHFVVGLVFLFFVPGWSIVGHLRLKNGALEISLSLGLSLALLLLVSEAALSWHFWHLVTLQKIVEGLCILSLGALALRLRGDRA